MIKNAVAKKTVAKIEVRRVKKFPEEPPPPIMLPELPCPNPEPISAPLPWLHQNNSDQKKRSNDVEKLEKLGLFP